MNSRKSASKYIFYLKLKKFLHDLKYKKLQYKNLRKFKNLNLKLFFKKKRKIRK